MDIGKHLDESHSFRPNGQRASEGPWTRDWHRKTHSFWPEKIPVPHEHPIEEWAEEFDAPKSS